MKVDLFRLKNRSKLRFRHTFREKFGVLGLKMVEIGQKSLFLAVSDGFLAVSDRKSHKISFSLAKMNSRAHFKIEKRVLRFVSENRFLVIWGLLATAALFVIVGNMMHWRVTLTTFFATQNKSTCSVDIYQLVLRNLHPSLSTSALRKLPPFLPAAR
jgi:hypothetical protein